MKGLDLTYQHLTELFYATWSYNAQLIVTPRYTKQSSNATYLSSVLLS